MNKELQETLRAILKEELEPINQRLDSMDTRLDSMDNRFDQIGSRLDSMDNRFDQMDSSLDKISKDVEIIKVSQEKLQQNLVDSIGHYTEEIIRYVDDKTEVLNKRLYKVESDVERLNRQ